jgi:hypothetical protein
VLERTIPGHADRDATGCYPLFACRDWHRLADDLTDLQSDLVSLVLVADPFGDDQPGLLEACFNRGVVPFKRHHVVEFGRPVAELASRHHRRNARKALGAVAVEQVDDPARYLDDWISMYDVLTRRHAIRGLRAFSPAAFGRQLAVPGIVAFRAEVGGKDIGMLLWYVQEAVAYYHLGAYSPEGYERNASFALFWQAIEWFTGKLRWLDLGAGAGIGDGPGGLDRFKAGWATGTRTAYLCRHVFQPGRYQWIASALGDPGTEYFPAYRAGEHSPAPLPRGRAG